MALLSWRESKYWKIKENGEEEEEEVKEEEEDELPKKEQEIEERLIKDWHGVSKDVKEQLF